MRISNDWVSKTSTSISIVCPEDKCDSRFSNTCSIREIRIIDTDRITYQKALVKLVENDYALYRRPLSLDLYSD